MNLQDLLSTFLMLFFLWYLLDLDLEEDEDEEEDDVDGLRLGFLDFRLCRSSGDRLGGVFPLEETLFVGGVLGIATLSFWD